ncbi:hypothetical protein EV363DRAFT_91316 [Boletus edulis]|nr:hypothetical protein EV363DRAFT_91316 [Boletus edulis]
MAQGKKLTPEIQWAIVRFSRMLTNDQIAMVPSDEEKPAETEVQGNRRLDEANVEFLLDVIQKAPDSYLDELQEMLGVSSGVEVSRATIWRSLRRAGFTMKQVTRVAAERSAEKRLEYIARIGLHIVGVHGQLEVRRPSVKHSLCADDAFLCFQHSRLVKASFIVTSLKDHSVLKHLRSSSKASLTRCNRIPPQTL